MNNELIIKMNAITLDCKEPRELAEFYAKLLHWDVTYSDEEYVCVSAPGAQLGAYPYLTFQRNHDYQPPVWPEKPGEQQQMAHLDLAVNDLAAAEQYALSCGATKAVEQFSEYWTVMLDPVGHPFCLCRFKEVIEGEHFALR